MHELILLLLSVVHILIKQGDGLQRDTCNFIFEANFGKISYHIFSFVLQRFFVCYERSCLVYLLAVLILLFDMLF